MKLADIEAENIRQLSRGQVKQLAGIVDAEFVSSVASSSVGRRGGTANGLGYPFPAATPLGSDGTIAEGKRHRVDHLVRGASNYTWDAPKKSR